jgi:hypothetical protein
MRTTSKLALAITSSAAVLLVGGAAWAHHSYAMFDRTKLSTMTGTVRTLQWTNPHVYVWVYANDKQDDQDVWGFEFVGGPNGLERSGWSKRTMNIGDKVTVAYHPLKDGRNGGEFENVVLPNGETWDARGKVPPEGRKPGATNPGAD